MRHGSILTDRPDGLAELTSRVAKAHAPAPLASIDWFKTRADGNLLGNDKYGCCDPAADFRLIQMWGGACTRQLVLERYSLLTGFNPTAPETDRGTDTAMDLNSWCAYPIFDGEKVWPIYWASVRAQDKAAILHALGLFPLLATICLPKAVEFEPERWKEMPGSGLAWLPTEPHRVVLGGWDQAARLWSILTWGMIVKVSEPLMESMLERGCIDAAIPHPDLELPDFQLSGIDFNALEEDARFRHSIGGV